MEEEAHGGGLQLADRRREALFKEQADNEFFWQAFKSAMASAGHRFGANTKPTDVFDFRFNEDFTDKVNTGKQLVRGGEVYSLPYGWKRRTGEGEIRPWRQHLAKVQRRTRRVGCGLWH